MQSPNGAYVRRGLLRVRAATIQSLLRAS
jgi:hypothetical protein